jgi:hypothetical protein
VLANCVVLSATVKRGGAITWASFKNRGRPVHKNCNRLVLRAPRLFEGEAVGCFAIVALLAVATCRFILAAMLAGLTIWTAARLF